jgi:hypothetical protein
MSETPSQRRGVRVPAAQSAVVLEMLINTYAVKADALAAAAGAYDDTPRDPLVEIQDARRELAEVEDALDALGWPPGPLAPALDLTGPPGLVREVLYGALLAAAETVGERCREYEAARVDRAGLAAAVDDVAVLHRLFAAFEATDAI